MGTELKELDDAICNHIASGSATHPTHARQLLKIAALTFGGGITERDERAWRLIDRRLQALKKAGRLRYDRPRWVLAGALTEAEYDAAIARFRALHDEIAELSASTPYGRKKTPDDEARYRKAMSEFIEVGKVLDAHWDTLP